jgi:EmrB/QacA subfamily drug resistance transporter
MPDITRPAYRTETDPKLRLLIPLVVACALFMETLDSTVISTSIPDMARSLGESPLRLSLAVTSYLLSLAVFIPVSGWMADRFGTRRVFCGAIILFTLGSALCGLSDNLPELVVTRILQGFGGAMMTPVGRLILLRSFPKEGLVTAMSYVTIPALIGPTLGPIIGGFLTTYASWRWIFYINIPIGLIGIVLALRHVEDFKLAHPPRFDFAGFCVLGLGLSLLELGIDSVGRDLLPAAAVAALFVGAALAFYLYGRHAHGMPNPALDLRLFRIRTFNISVLGGGVCRIGLGTVPFLLPLMLQIGFGMNAMESGALTFVSGLGAMLMKTAAPLMMRRIGFRRLLAVNAVIVALAIGGIALFDAATPHWLITIYLLVFGFLRSVQFTGINALAFADLRPSIMSRGTSISSVAQQLSMSFGVAVGASLLALLTGPAAAATADDFRVVFILVATLPLGSVVSFLRLKPGDGAEVSGYKVARTGTLPAPPALS